MSRIGLFNHPTEKCSGLGSSISRQVTSSQADTRRRREDKAEIAAFFNEAADSIADMESEEIPQWDGSWQVTGCSWLVSR